MKNLLFLLLLAPATANAWFIFWWGSGNQEAKFREAVETVDKNPPNRAIAVAKGSQWAWGGAWGHQTPEDAVKAAVARCETGRKEREIEEPCQVYSVNGQVR